MNYEDQMDYEYEKLRDEACQAGLSVRAYQKQQSIFPDVPSEEEMLISKEVEDELEESLRSLEAILGGK